MGTLENEYKCLYKEEFNKQLQYYKEGCWKDSVFRCVRDIPCIKRYTKLTESEFNSYLVMEELVS